MANLLLAPVVRFLGRLSYPKLFLLTAALFVFDLFVPDLVPFIDELLLGLGTLLLANWKNRRQPGTPDGDSSRVIDGDSRRR